VPGSCWRRPRRSGSRSTTWSLPHPPRCPGRCRRCRRCRRWPSTWRRWRRRSAPAPRRPTGPTGGSPWPASATGPWTRSMPTTARWCWLMRYAGHSSAGRAATGGRRGRTASPRCGRCPAGPSGPGCSRRTRPGNWTSPPPGEPPPGAGRHRAGPRLDAVRTTIQDPDLDLLLVRLHLESGARREGALNLRLGDLDPRRSTALLREKFGLEREQPIPPSLVGALESHARGRGAAGPQDPVFRTKRGDLPRRVAPRGGMRPYNSRRRAGTSPPRFHHGRAVLCGRHLAPQHHRRATRWRWPGARRVGPPASRGAARRARHRAPRSE
jgi:hypothetical protein